MYEIDFTADSLNQWNKLQKAPRERFRKMLAKRQENPRVQSSSIRGQTPNLYRLKISDEGMRLIYEVDDATKTILVLVIGKRDNGEVYDEMQFIRLI